jgi:hypothetical protein
MFEATLRPLYPWETDSIPIVQEPVWVSETVRTGAENLALNGIGSPDRPASSQ